MKAETVLENYPKIGDSLHSLQFFIRSQANRVEVMSNSDQSRT